MQSSLKHIYNTLELFTLNHRILQSFYDKNSEPVDYDLNYPLLWVQTDYMAMKYGEIQFNLIVCVLDRLEDVENTTKVLSDTALIIEDLLNIFNDNVEEFDFNVDMNNIKAMSINDAETSKLCGWSVPLNFKVGSSLNEYHVPILQNTGVQTIDALIRLTIPQNQYSIIVNSPSYLATSKYPLVSVMSGCTQVVLDECPTVGQVYVITDVSGTAYKNPITISVYDNWCPINNGQTMTIDIAYGSVTMYYNGQSFIIISSVIISQS